MMVTFITHSLFSLVLLQVGVVRAFSQCYYPDGSIPTDYIWQPCTGAKYSSCCVPSEGDICQENGLCWYPSSSSDDPGVGSLYRGTCTDRTWNDPACNVDICVSGFETSWMYLAMCKAGNAVSTVCGTMSDGLPATPTCASGAATNTGTLRLTRTSSSAVRYTAPPSVDPSLYSVFTSTYTTAITAVNQRTTLTSTFQSTFTSAIGKAVVSATASEASTTASSGSTSSGAVAAASGGVKDGITLTTGVLVAIIAGPLLAIAIGVAVFLYLRKRRSTQKGESIRLDDNYPPPNGPVGADQIHPYEVDVNEVTSSGLKREYSGYRGPKVDTYEIDDRNVTLRSDKLASEKLAVATELGVRDQEVIRSPAPTYHEALMPVELDDTSVRGRSRG